MLNVQDLYREYSNGIVLDHISFEIDEGDFFVLFGPDESGKTELLYNIMGLHHHKSGTIEYEDAPIRHLNRELRQSIRMVPDDIIISDNLTGEEYLRDILTQYKTDDDMLYQLSDYFELELRERVTDMTYENNKLLAITGALITYPHLLILDEPANFLTTEGYNKLLALLKKLNEHGMTVLMALEKYSDADGLCNRFLYIKDGSTKFRCKINKPVDFYKAVTVYKGDSDALKKYLGEPIARNKKSTTYLYMEEKGNLYEIFYKSKVGNNDFLIESLTLEEMLDQDYERWQNN